MNTKQNFKVSVCMITYGHEKYIKQAVEGVLMQECNFEVELLIADDCSPDNTREIIKEIQQSHINGSFIKYTKHITNKGMMGNFIWALEQCQGKYIALCEGDDYWIDSLKLQKQIDFLEINSNLDFCFHLAYKVKDKDIDFNNFYPKNLNDKELDEKEFFEISSIPTASVVCKNNFSYPRLLHSHGDFILYCKLLSSGAKVGVLNEVMSVYRVHEQGVSFNSTISNNYIKNRISELMV